MPYSNLCAAGSIVDYGQICAEVVLPLWPIASSLIAGCSRQNGTCPVNLAYDNVRYRRVAVLSHWFYLRI